MRAALPPLTAVRVFEAAARHGNFTRAADELGMTQSAVSYQIKVLEDRVGAELFRRRSRGVELTPIGHRLAQRTTESLNDLRDAFEEIRVTSEEVLRTSVAPTVAVSFLGPRLGLFQIANPSILVRLEVSEALADFGAGDVDMAIRSGRGDWPNLVCERLLKADLSPMLTPELADSIGGVSSPSDLLKVPLINSTSEWWPAWFAKAGVRSVVIPEQPELQFGAQVMEANAVLAGLGVGKLTPSLYRDAVEQGRLCQPFSQTYDAGDAFWLVHPPRRRQPRKVEVFKRWLLAEAVGFDQRRD